MVENIRIKLASGLYTKTSLWLDMKNQVSWELFDAIAEYRMEKDTRKDLKARIQQLPKAISAYEEYQDELRKEYIKAEAMELSGNKHYPFREKQQVAYSILLGKLQEYPDVSVDELPKCLSASF